MPCELNPVCFNLPSFLECDTGRCLFPPAWVCLLDQKPYPCRSLHKEFGSDLPHRGDYPLLPLPNTRLISCRLFREGRPPEMIASPPPPLAELSFRVFRSTNIPCHFSQDVCVFIESVCVCVCSNRTSLVPQARCLQLCFGRRSEKHLQHYLVFSV